MAYRLGVVLFWVCVVIGVLHAASIIALFVIGHPRAADFAWTWLPIDMGLIVFGVAARYVLSPQSERKGR